jgi:hypothetical protein
MRYSQSRAHEIVTKQKDTGALLGAPIVDDRVFWASAHSPSMYGTFASEFTPRRRRHVFCRIDRDGLSFVLFVPIGARDKSVASRVFAPALPSEAGQTGLVDQIPAIPHAFRPSTSII